MRVSVAGAEAPTGRWIPIYISRNDPLPRFRDRLGRGEYYNSLVVEDRHGNTGVVVVSKYAGSAQRKLFDRGPRSCPETERFVVRKAREHVFRFAPLESHPDRPIVDRLYERTRDDGIRRIFVLIVKR